MDADSVSSAPQVPKGGKFFWSSEHDVKLVECLQELNLSTYWRVDTTFRNGYLTEAERMMGQKLPGCGIKGVPHIESRCKTLRKQTLAIADMLNNGSGFAWDDVEKQIKCDQDVFKLWCQSHKDAKGLRNKPFPHFEALIEIYGKDRANGNAAADPTDVEEDICNTVDTQNDNDITNEGLDGIVFSSTQSEQSPPPSKTNAGNKRLKTNSDVFASSLADMAVSMKSFVECLSVNMEKMTASLLINHESEQGKKVVTELLSCEGLEMDDVIDASTIIIGNASYESLLFVLQGEPRKKWVLKLLGKGLNP